MSLDFLLLYLITVFVASIIPGPSMLLALTHGMRYGTKRTMASAMGNVTVTLGQATISIVGLGTILLASETTFNIIKLLGALYLIYIGITFLFSKEPLMSSTDALHVKKTVSLKKIYFEGAFVTAGNPKAIIFFSAVFPQFIDPNHAYISQSIILLVLLCIIAFICFMLYAFGGEKLVRFFANVKVGKWIQRVIGSTFVGAGITLAMSER